MTDEWAESIGPSVFEENNDVSEDDQDNEALSEEDQQEQREKINLDVKRLETFLENFDYFSGKSRLDRHKLKFHADYLKARAVYYDNIMVFPDLEQNIGKASSTEATEENKDVDSGDGQPEAIESESNPSKPNTSPDNTTNTLALVN